MANETSSLLAQKQTPVSVDYDHVDGNKEAATAVTLTKTPKNRLKIQAHDHGQTTPPITARNRQNMIASTPMSSCSTGTSATASTMTSTSDNTAYFSTSHYQGELSGRPGESTPSSTSTSTSTKPPSTSIRVHLPSPTRSRLDRQYAKRLAASSLLFQTPTAKSPTCFPTNPAISSTSRTSNNHKLISSPRIGRECDSSMIFRPSSIVSIDTMHSSGGAPGRFFFPSTSPTRQETTSNNSNNAFLSRNNNINSTLHESASSCAGTNGMTLSLSRRRRNLSAVNSIDMGISDRFIPSRATSSMSTINLWDSMNSNSNGTSRLASSRQRYHSMEGVDNTIDSGVAGNSDGTNTNSNAGVGTDDSSNTASGGSVNPATGRVNETSSITTQQTLHNVLLRSELLGENISPYSYAGSQTQVSLRQTGSDSSSPLRDGMNRLRFQSPRQAYHDTIYSSNMGVTSVVNSFSLTPFGTASSQHLMATPQKHRRKIAKVPFKVLDAPALQDDFYLNLVDWSSQNVLAVGLGSCVYLWSACTSKVTKLCDLAESEDIVTSVSWAQRGTHLAVGTNKGEVQLWDTIKVKKVRTMSGHTARVGTLAWTGPILASGSRDRLIFLRDVREKSAFTSRLNAHRQEVCGLKWSYDEPAFLASGGNDNQLHVVDSRNPTQPIHRFTDHTAAVKAIAWSPHQHGLLASGGGTADRCIRFWNTLSGSALNCVDTGSQVCNLAWSQNCNEIVSTHGYSLNQIVVWRYPSLSKVVTLTGHTYRVLYLAMSPDGSTIVTGAGDETLRFWQVFPGPRSDAKNNAGGLLFPNTLGSVIR